MFKERLLKLRCNMSGQTMTTVLKWVLYLCGAVAVSEAYMTRIDQCEPIEIPKCRAMPYNMTQMPNLVHHNTQENARLVFEKFEVLLDQNCSDSLLFLLCSIYVPICAVSLQPEAIPPCRSVCEKAKAGCEPLMNSYNVSWPESLDCSRLPRYERGVCVSPEAFVKPVKPKKAKGACQRDCLAEVQPGQSVQQMVSPKLRLPYKLQFVKVNRCV
ncbi:secreted frizzled-related protein 3 [Biomphalaria pfeifferi]|uniref:Secreted frizzled-related protein 3 n=1 Tax=Biomphalaria pfeifferi TaxID=112525 RepID=A0AAD8B8K7_BIOPF|nr:secreted frizzled-related protein 3 [Biomphalaria pfeifferi]